MEKDDVGQYCESRILLLRQNDCRVQQGYLEVEVRMWYIWGEYEILYLNIYDLPPICHPFSKKV